MIPYNSATGCNCHCLAMLTGDFKHRVSSSLILQCQLQVIHKPDDPAAADTSSPPAWVVFSNSGAETPPVKQNEVQIGGTHTSRSAMKEVHFSASVDLQSSFPSAGA